MLLSAVRARGFASAVQPPPPPAASSRSTRSVAILPIGRTASQRLARAVLQPLDRPSSREASTGREAAAPTDPRAPRLVGPPLAFEQFDATLDHGQQLVAGRRRARGRPCLLRRPLASVDAGVEQHGRGVFPRARLTTLGCNVDGEPVVPTVWASRSSERQTDSRHQSSGQGSTPSRYCLRIGQARPAGLPSAWCRATSAICYPDFEDREARLRTSSAPAPAHRVLRAGRGPRYTRSARGDSR